MEAIVAGKALLRWCLYGWFVDPIKEHIQNYMQSQSALLPPLPKDSSNDIDVKVVGTNDASANDSSNDDNTKDAKA